MTGTKQVKVDEFLFMKERVTYMESRKFKSLAIISNDNEIHVSG